MYQSNLVHEIRDVFVDYLKNQTFTIDKSGVKTIELCGAAFMADEDSIFGEPNAEYIARELAWYKSCSLYVKDIPGTPPDIWTKVADKNGMINSNYGWCIWSGLNYTQYLHVMHELEDHPFSRRAVMIYTRPKMWAEYNDKGRSDFICTNVVQYVIRDERLHAIVQMRSNDVVYGYRNDYAWQSYVLDELARDLGVLRGKIRWMVGSLHVYEPHFYLVDHFARTGESTITKKRYRELYPDSEYCK